MRSKLTMTFLIALLSLASGSAMATHEGTWHGGDSTVSAAFCDVIGDFAGEDLQSLCGALLE